MGEIKIKKENTAEGKNLYIAEKPSVAREFANVLSENFKSFDGYLESENSVVTWCVGHLATMSYPEAYDESMARWSLSALPFIPDTFLYEVIPQVKKQFKIVSSLLARRDVKVIYVCTDAGREGEYIYRLVEQLSGVSGKERRRVWINSHTKDEILRGIREAADLSEYDRFSDAAYLRAKEDYLMGINFSRLLTLKYGNEMAHLLGERHMALSVGRVISCVLGMVVSREREIRNFIKTPFYRVLADIKYSESRIEVEWRVCDESVYLGSSKLYKENGFLKREDAVSLTESLLSHDDGCKDGSEEAVRGEHIRAEVISVSEKKEKKYPPLLYNLAELQNECSKLFKISPDESLRIAQDLYEKKLITYPRTDARVLSSAVAGEIKKTVEGLKKAEFAAKWAEKIIENSLYEKLAESRYTNDKLIGDHYAIIPTGEGISALSYLAVLHKKVYEVITCRFLAVFFDPALFRNIKLVIKVKREQFFSSSRIMLDPGYQSVMRYSFQKDNGGERKDLESEINLCAKAIDFSKIRKGMRLPIENMQIKEGETAPPKRFSSGSIILAMENAGKLIEDAALREQIRGSGIGTSATRAEIVKKLIRKKYISLNGKTQIITPTISGEMLYDILQSSIQSLLNPELTASWERGLSYVEEGTVSPDEYMEKLSRFVRSRVEAVKRTKNEGAVRASYQRIKRYY